MHPATPAPDDLVACTSVMLELSICFKDFWSDCALIGGWVPYLLLETRGDYDATNPHCGSLDVDLLIDVDAVGREGYSATAALVRARGYSPGESSFELVRTVGTPVLPHPRDVRVHLMAPVAASGRRPARRRVPGGLQTVALDFADLALQHTFDHELVGRLPTGETHAATIRVADEVACFTMKGGILPRPGRDEFSRKDAYDLFMLLRYHRSGPSGVGRLVRRFMALEPVRAAVENVRVQFASPDCWGSTAAVRYLVGSDPSASPRDVEVLRNDVQSAFDEFLRSVAHGR